MTKTVEQKLSNGAKTAPLLRFVQTHAFMSSLVVVVAISAVIGLVAYRQPSSTPLVTATDKEITRQQQRLSTSPSNVGAMIALSNAFLQKVRETADFSYYLQVDKLLIDAKRIEPNNADIPATSAAVAYGRHDFSGGLALAEQAHALNLNKIAYFGLIGDGQIELGRYPEAVNAFQNMVNRRPDLSSLNRVAYIREIYGDISGAESALTQAISAGSSFPENVAYSQTELGKLYLRHDAVKADQAFQQALATVKNYPPALEGRGKIAFIKRDYVTAIRYFTLASTTLPIAQYATDLGDAYQASGQTTKAAQQYELAKLAYAQAQAAGVNDDLEQSVFLADRKLEPAEALKRAQSAHLARPNIFAADALAWAKYQTGDYEGAAVSSQEALRLGEFSPSILYHAGMIALKRNDREQAKNYITKAFALDQNFSESHFSLLDAEKGRNALKGL